MYLSPFWLTFYVSHFTKKPVILFTIEIKWLVSIWNATLGWNGLKAKVAIIQKPVNWFIFESNYCFLYDAFCGHLMGERCKVGINCENNWVKCMQIFWKFLVNKFHINPLDTGRKLNVRNIFSTLCAFNLRPVSWGEWDGFRDSH